MAASGIKAKALGGFLSSKRLLRSNVVDSLPLEMQNVKLAFQAARKHPKECRRARLDIDWRVRNAVAKWKRVDR